MLLDSNSKLNKDNTTSTTKLQMYSLLEEGQAAVQKEIMKVRNVTLELALDLRSTGLNGTSARERINQTLAQDPYIIDILTYNATGTILAVNRPPTAIWKVSP